MNCLFAHIVPHFGIGIWRARVCFCLAGWCCSWCDQIHGNRDNNSTLLARLLRKNCCGKAKHSMYTPRYALDASPGKQEPAFLWARIDYSAILLLPLKWNKHMSKHNVSTTLEMRKCTNFISRCHNFVEVAVQTERFEWHPCSIWAGKHFSPSADNHFAIECMKTKVCKWTNINACCSSSNANCTRFAFVELK